MKTFLITGASRGLWKEMASILRGEWYKVYDLSREGDIVCDLRDQQSIDKAISFIKDTVSSIDCIINCAGGGEIESIDSFDFAHADETWKVNTLGHAYLIAWLREQIKAQGTDIITIWATIGYKANEYMPLYSVAKWWLRGLVENRRQGLKGTASRVILVSPWWLDGESNLGPDGRETKITQITGKDPGIMLSTEEIAKFILNISQLPKNMEVSEVIINRK